MYLNSTLKVLNFFYKGCAVGDRHSSVHRSDYHAREELLLNCHNFGQRSPFWARHISRVSTQVDCRLFYKLQIMYSMWKPCFALFQDQGQNWGFTPLMVSTHGPMQSRVKFFRRIFFGLFSPPTPLSASPKLSAVLGSIYRERWETLKSNKRLPVFPHRLVGWQELGLELKVPASEGMDAFVKSSSKEEKGKGWLGKVQVLRIPWCYWLCQGVRAHCNETLA